MLGAKLIYGVKNMDYLYNLSLRSFLCFQRVIPTSGVFNVFDFTLLQLNERFD